MTGPRTSKKGKDNGREEYTQQVAGDLTEDQLREARDQMRDLIAEGDIQVGIGSDQMEQKLGVLQRMITAVQADKEYRQILLLAAFDDKTEALLVADAIDERERYGVDIHPILNRVICQCAVHGDRMQRVLNAMSQHQLTTNFGSSNWKPGWKKRDDNNGISS